MINLPKNLKLVFCFSALLAGGCRIGHAPLSDDQKALHGYNVAWTSPSQDHHGSMPAGNGDIGLNVWVENKGDLCFYIGKTDSWGDNGRLLKVGKVRVKCDPEIIFPGADFKQELDLFTGTVKISTSGIIDGKKTDLNFQVWADANNPVIHVSHESTVPLKMKACIELWRTIPDTLTQLEVSDLLRDQPDSVHQPVVVEPDSVIRTSAPFIGWLHHNRKSVGFDLTNQIQGLSGHFKTDPVLHRTFGAIITGTGTTKIDDQTLETSLSKTGRLNIYVLTTHPSKPDEWLAAICELSDRIERVPFYERKKAHEKWWAEFWDRSWIHATVSGNDPTDSSAFVVSRAYALQRFIDASGGRGNYPIKFNGSIFTVPAKENTEGDADYRRWGPGYWWQNTRLPYLSACAAGDFDVMLPFFRMYAEEIYQVCKYRTNKYFGFDGVYYPECMTFWGAVFLQTYGWTPYGKREDKLQESGWHKWEWVSGPELVFMMLDYYDYTGDQDFLKSRIIPVANDVIRFFDNYYQTDGSDKLVMHPSMACETWWNCTNPMPELAGLHSITRRLMGLSGELTNDQDKQYWKSFRAKLPEIPLRETPSGKALAPAEKFEDKRNVENPELYAVFPFRLYGTGNPDPDYAKNALEYRWDKGDFGWRQDDIFMAYLGLAGQAKENLVARSKNFDQNSRFPAFWGPNYDWTPDQDHGGVLMKAFQSMVLQADPYSEKFYLLPAWPRDWDVSFKLHAPHQTTIEGRVKDGKIEWLKVTPESRRDDLVIMRITPLK